MADIENAISLYFVILIPIDSAAILLSRIAMIALPERELIRLSTIISVITRRIIPIINDALCGVPVIPVAPFMISLPSDSIFKSLAFVIQK